MKKTVVLIDDSIHILKLLTRFYVDRLGFKVSATGTDGNQATLLYRKHLPDLISLDISMPNKNGVDACRDIISEFPDAKIIITTAVRGSEIAECLSYGAKGYIFKPLNFDDKGYVLTFKETVERVMRGEI